MLTSSESLELADSKTLFGSDACCMCGADLDNNDILAEQGFCCAECKYNFEDAEECYE